MSSPFMQFSEIFQKLKGIDLDKISSLSAKVDLKDILEKLSKMDEDQIRKVEEFIQQLSEGK